MTWTLSNQRAGTGPKSFFHRHIDQWPLEGPGKACADPSSLRPKPFSALQRLLTGRGHPARKCYGDPWDPGDTFVDYGEVDLSHGMNVLEELPTAEIERSNADAILTRSAQRF